MKFIGFQLTKISAENMLKNTPHGNINTNIEFKDLQKTQLDMIKEEETLTLTFSFMVSYLESEEKKEVKHGEIAFEGKILILASKDETKEFLKSWKKKEIPSQTRMPLFNAILKRCTIRAMQLEEEINLPSHLPLPQLRPDNS